MTPQELKNSILQLAIQGKLVEQHPEEGTAEELFARIQEEKQRLIKEGKIRINKKVELISDDIIPFDIPDSWLWIRFADLVNYSMGKTPPRVESEWWGSDIPWVSISDMPEGGHVCKTKECVTAAAIAQKFGNKISPAGTLLMSFKLTVGRVSILDVDAVHNEAIISIYPFVDNAGTEKKYLFYVLPFISQFGESKNAIKGKTLNDTSISNLLIPLPPLAEQKRIVAKIEELLPNIDRYEQAWSKLEQFNTRFPEDMKKSLLQYAIQGKLVEQRPEEGTVEELFAQIQEEKQQLIKAGKIKKEKPLPPITDDEKPFDIPESWMWVRVQEVTYLNPKNDLPDELEVSFIPMALIDDGYRNSHSFEIRTWGSIKKGFTHFSDGDIGIAKITPCFQNRKSVIFHNLKNRYGAGTTEISIVRVINDLLSRDFLLWFFKSTYFIDNGVKSFTGTAGQQRIHKDYLAKCVLPLPPLAEQKRIVEKLEQLLPLCERLK